VLVSEMKELVTPAPCWTDCTPKPGVKLTLSSADVLISTVTGMFSTVPPATPDGVTTKFAVQVPAVMPAVFTLTLTVAGVLVVLAVAFNQFAGQLAVAVIGGTDNENPTGWAELPICTPCADGGSWLVS
jgi:hypothetical protein